MYCHLTVILLRLMWLQWVHRNDGSTWDVFRGVILRCKCDGRSYARLFCAVVWSAVYTASVVDRVGAYLVERLCCMWPYMVLFPIALSVNVVDCLDLSNHFVWYQFSLKTRSFVTPFRLLYPNNLRFPKIFTKTLFSLRNDISSIFYTNDYRTFINTTNSACLKDLH